jgi:RNA polymerase sigma-70 factor (ECF subfamily)
MLNFMISGQFPYGKRKDKREIFWTLAQEHARFLYNAAFKYTGNRNDAEDLIQETLYKGFHKFHQLRDERKFKGWVFTIGTVMSRLSRAKQMMKSALLRSKIDTPHSAKVVRLNVKR